MPMTSYLRKKLGDHSLGEAAYAFPTQVFLALFTASPGAGGSFSNEVTGGSYARIDITSVMGAFDLTSGISVNGSEINFATPTANWGTITHVGIVDNLSPANILYYQAVASPRNVTNGSRRVQFASSQLQVQMI